MRTQPISESLYEWRASEIQQSLYFNAINRGYVIEVGEDAIGETVWFGYQRTGKCEWVTSGTDVETVKRAVLEALPDPTPCKAMFCTGTTDTCDGQEHVDVTGATWYEDTREYAGEVIAHIITVTEGDE